MFVGGGRGGGHAHAPVGETHGGAALGGLGQLRPLLQALEHLVEVVGALSVGRGRGRLTSRH